MSYGNLQQDNDTDPEDKRYDELVAMLTRAAGIFAHEYNNFMKFGVKEPIDDTFKSTLEQKEIEFNKDEQERTNLNKYGIVMTSTKAMIGKHWEIYKDLYDTIIPATKQTIVENAFFRHFHDKHDKKLKQKYNLS